ncbi:MAG: hypothetical protein GF311_08685 [Candidatus Lokiarchaeota archaeon]|nr:hypothetical protein [Candidatus Lokiarchaeota archaeon]
MLRKDLPNKKPIECPICHHKFIPKSYMQKDTWFYWKSPYGKLETMTLEDKILWRGPGSTIKRISERDSDDFLYNPSAISLKNWVTLCQNCGNNLYFASKVAVKKSIKNTEIDPSVREFGKGYYYEILTYPPPYYDYNKYYEELLNDYILKIDNAIEDINLQKLSGLLKRWKEGNIEIFKYIIKFNTQVEKYCNEHIENFSDKPMPQKIEECEFSSELESKLKEINRLRNKLVHDDYELDDNNMELIIEGFYLLIKELLLRELLPIKLNSGALNQGYEFINNADIKFGIKRHLNIILSEVPRVRNYNFNEILKNPILEGIGYPSK